MAVYARRAHIAALVTQTRIMEWYGSIRAARAYSGYVEDIDSNPIRLTPDDVKHKRFLLLNVGDITKEDIEYIKNHLNRYPDTHDKMREFKSRPFKSSKPPKGK